MIGLATGARISFKKGALIEGNEETQQDYKKGPLCSNCGWPGIGWQFAARKTVLKTGPLLERFIRWVRRS